MLKELVEFLVGLGRSSSAVSVQDLDKRTQIIVSNGTYVERSRTPDSKQKNLLSLESLMEWSRRNGREGGYFVVNDSEIRYFTDSVFEHDWANLTLNHSKPFRELLRIGSPQTPKQLVRVLRTGLKGCLDSVAFVSMIEKIDFKRAMTTTHTARHGQESMGRSVEMQVNPAYGNLDEEVSFTLPLWSNPEFDFRLQIVCAVVVDHDAEKISLEPVGDSLDHFRDRNIALAFDVVRSSRDCTQEEVPVYLGLGDQCH